MAEKLKAEEEEYESDLDDTPFPRVRRRAAASDDEEEDEGGGGMGSQQPPSVGSDSDGQGAAELYDDGDDSEECEEVYEKLGAGSADGEAKEVADGVVAAPEDEGKCEEEEKESEAQSEAAVKGEEKETEAQSQATVKGDGNEAEADATVEGEGKETAVKGEEKEEKRSEPYAVPRIGAFFMHDDRLQDQENGSYGRQREFVGEQKLWYPKDDRLWVHDRFYEMNTHHVQHGNARRPMGSLRAWGGGRPHDVDRGYFVGTKSGFYFHDDRRNYQYVPKEFHSRSDSTKVYNRFPKESHTPYENAKNYRGVPRKFHSYYDGKNFDNAPREPHTYYGRTKVYNNEPNVYRGRPSRHYQPHWKSAHEISSVQNNRPYFLSQNEDASYNADHSSQNLCLQYEQNLRQKHTFPSNKRSASPPFYPSRPPLQELPFIQRRKVQPGNCKLFSSSVRMAHSSPKPRSHPNFVVKAFVPSGGHGNSADSRRTVAIEGMAVSHSQSSISISNNYSKYSKSWDQGRGIIGEPREDSISSRSSQATRSYTESGYAVYRQRSVQQPFQPTPRVSTQTFRPKNASTHKVQSHSQTTLSSSTEDAETSTPPGSNNSRSLSVVKGQNVGEAERALFPSGRDHALSVTGARGLTLGDQGFTGTPGQLPAMQYSVQHPSGPSIPSIGMALPGFLAQEQLGGNPQISEITWLPISGPLGASYNQPCFPSHCPQPSEIASSSVFPRGHSGTEVPMSLISQEISVAVGHELGGQRKNKPRRYSEMNFALGA